MKKGSLIVPVIVLVVVIGGAYAIFHKSNKPATTSATASSSSSPKSDSTIPAVNNAVLITKTSSSLGQYLAEPNGQPLYTYNNDSSGMSNCTGSCIASWPAYQDAGATTNLPAGISTIKRADNGQTQYTYNGMPLYTFVSDTGGKATGDGVEGFSIAKPAAATSNTQPTNSSASTDATSPSY